MGPTKSYELGRLNRSSLRIFISSQSTKAPPMPSSTSAQGLTVLLTGGYQGIGLACTEWLINLNVSRLIIAGRTVRKGEAAIKEFEKKFPGKIGTGPNQTTIEIWEVDMAKYNSVQDFVARVNTLDKLDVAILNAGIVLEEFRLGPEGHEEIMQVNYISTVLLAHLLLPILKSKATPGKPGRLTVVNSGTAYFASMPHRNKTPLLKNYTTLSKEKWDPTEQYSASKALGHFWIAKLAEKVNPDNVIVNLVDPGLVKGTALHRELSTVAGAIFAAVKSLTGRTMKNGASTLIDATLVKGKETHGSYLMDWKIMP